MSTNISFVEETEQPVVSPSEEDTEANSQVSETDSETLEMDENAGEDTAREEDISQE